MDNQNIEKNYILPAAILVGALVVAGAIIFSSSRITQETTGQQAAVGQNNQPQGSPDNMKPVTEDDHILGSINAQVKLVVFSDPECPFCKDFNSTVEQAFKEYGKDKLAIVFRAFPLDAIHPKSRKELEATECANELGGVNKYWAYLNRLFEITPSNNNLDPAELPKIAAYVGLDNAKFEACLSSGKYEQKVADYLDDAVNAGGQGTPYSVLVAKNGKKIVVSGAQPYEQLKSAIDQALKEI